MKRTMPFIIIRDIVAFQAEHGLIGYEEMFCFVHKRPLVQNTMTKKSRPWFHKKDWQ